MIRILIYDTVQQKVCPNCSYVYAFGIRNQTRVSLSMVQIMLTCSFKFVVSLKRTKFLDYGERKWLTIDLSSSCDQPLSLIEFLNLHQADEDFEAEEGADYVCDVCRHLDTEFSNVMQCTIRYWIELTKNEQFIEGWPWLS